MKATAAHSRFWPLRSTKMRPTSKSRETATPRDWLSRSDSSRPSINVGRRCDWSSINGFERRSSAAAVCEAQVATSFSGRSV